MPSLTPQEAAASLAEIESARSAMRRVIRAHRGHYYLWIWGVAWIAMPLLAHFRGDQAMRYFPWICLAGGIASAAVGFTQSSQIKTPVNGRLIALLAAILGFAAVFPFILRSGADSRMYYAYACLVTMQAYVVEGLWTDTYLLWVGLLVTALILVGVWCFPGIFWLWMAACGGGTLLATGFYVRHFWR